MLTGLTQFFEALLNSGVLVPAVWLTLGFFIAWFLLSAKRFAALSHEEVEMLWRVHKQKARCKAQNCEMMKRRGKIVGFKCECGHKHVQQKPIIDVSTGT